MKHIDKMAKIILLTGTIVGYAYLMELFVAWYQRRTCTSATAFCIARRRSVLAGPTTAMMFCNVIAPQVFWFKKCRDESGLGVMIIVQCS